MYRFVFGLFREKSAVSQCITWRHPVSVKRVAIEGTTSYAVSGMFFFILCHLKSVPFFSFELVHTAEIMV